MIGKGLNGESLRIHDWDEHQSYRKDRGQPPWIKVHRHIMRNMKWVALDDAERGQLVAIWLLAADHDGVIPASPAIVQKLCFMSDPPDLNKFIDLGFLDGDRRQDDVTSTSDRRRIDHPETEAETEKRRKTLWSNRIDAPTPDPASNRFDEFWAAYPKKVAKKKAAGIWKRRKLDKVADRIIADVKRRTTSDGEWVRGFVPHPTTYLNGDRWEDEVESETQQAVTALDLEMIDPEAQPERWQKAYAQFKRQQGATQ